MDDFTTRAYVRLLDAAAARFRFVSYEEAATATGNGLCIWRHDVDISPQRAVVLARLEAERGIRATYFVQVGAEFYNAFERDCRRCFREISTLGHWVGLHFDAGAWPGSDSVLMGIQREVNALRNLLSIPVDTVSLHNPATYDMDRFLTERLAGLYNGSASCYRDGWEYCSDSNGLWRFRPLLEVIEDPSTLRLHALTHAEWWQDQAMAPRQRIQRSIDGRAGASARFYDQLLAGLRRPNVGKGGA